MPTAPRKSTPKPAAESDVATNLALDWLIREAFRSGRWAHAPVIIEDSTLPDEVKDVLYESYGRASS